MKKFVARLDHISYDPARGRNREILYVTERATFRRHEGRLALIEAAPGVDVARDILARMEFEPLNLLDRRDSLAITQCSPPGM
jgi:propionate CoA-transferase